MAGASSFYSCYGHNCDPSSDIYGLKSGEGQLAADDIWESTPEESDAIPYTRERTWFFKLPMATDREILEVIPYVRADSNINVTGGNETIGSGNLAEISGVGPGQFAIRNDTCADYFIRVVVRLAPVGPTAPSVPSADAGGDAADAN